MKLDIFPNDDGTFCIGEYGKYAPLVQEFAAAHSLEDAQLIAAAPVMLAALKELAAIAEAGVIERRETGKPSWNIMDAIKATTGEAIAKAEGRE